MGYVDGMNLYQRRNTMDGLDAYGEKERITLRNEIDLAGPEAAPEKCVVCCVALPGFDNNLVQWSSTKIDPRRYEGISPVQVCYDVHPQFRPYGALDPQECHFGYCQPWKCVALTPRWRKLGYQDPYDCRNACMEGGVDARYTCAPPSKGVVMPPFPGTPPRHPIEIGLVLADILWGMACSHCCTELVCDEMEPEAKHTTVNSVSNRAVRAVFVARQ